MSGGHLRAEFAVPAFEQPLGVGKFDGAIGPCDRFTPDLAQHGIGEARSRAESAGLHQLHALAYGGVRRHAIEIAQLVDAHAQRQQHFEIELAKPAAGVVLDQEIELRLVAQHAEHDLRGERRHRGNRAARRRREAGRTRSRRGRLCGACRKLSGGRKTCELSAAYRLRSGSG